MSSSHSPSNCILTTAKGVSSTCQFVPRPSSIAPSSYYLVLTMDFFLFLIASYYGLTMTAGIQYDSPKKKKGIQYAHFYLNKIFQNITIKKKSSKT